LIHGSVIRSLRGLLNGLFLQHGYLSAEIKQVLRMTNAFGSFGETKEQNELRTSDLNR